VIIVYGGGDGAFSDDLRKRVRGLVSSLKPTSLIGGRSTDADLLFARTALMEGVGVHVVASSAEAADRGPGWAAEWDRLLRNRAVTELAAGRYVPDATHLLDRAQALAERGEAVWLITVRSGTATDLMLEADERRILTLEVWPESRPEKAFVVMPYDRKTDVQSGKEVDCDQTLHKIYRPLLENAGLTWSRSDLETDTGIIHPGMLEQLANSDVVLADLTTTNFNVAYELGARHLLAPRSTVLVSPQVLEIGPRQPPFDVEMSRIHHFDRGLTLTDEQAEAAIRSLEPVLAKAIDGTAPDSPAYKWFEMDHDLRPLRLREEVREYENRLTAARRRVSDVVAGGDPEAMTAEAKRLGADPDLPKRVRQALRIELAAALLAEARYREARDLLALCEPSRDDALHRVWLQRTTMAHRRLGEEEERREPGRGLEHFRKAQELLAALVEAGYGDSETFGIWGGLIKREIQAAGPPLTDPATELLFEKMTEKYREGFERDPDHYPGVNLVMALRLAPRSGRFDAEFPEVVAATRLFARRAIKIDRWDAVWARFTLAELSLHEALEHDTDPAEASRLYISAAGYARADQLDSVRFQLRFLRTFGQRADVLTPLLTRLGEPPS